MWHKRHRPRDDEAPPGKRLRDNLADLYSSGDVAGDRAQSLFQDAADFSRSLGSHDFQEMRGADTAGSRKNASRDLQRRLLRRSHWPPLYVQEVRSWSVKEQAEVTQKVAVLLPHEVLAVIAEVSDHAVLFENEGLDATNRAKHARIYEALQSPFVSLSLWGDGVPFSWDRKRSADLWTLSFPGLQRKEYRDIRICLTAMPHHCVVKSTQDDLMKIFAWSLKALAVGRFPTARADGSEWLPQERWRRQRGGQVLIKGALVEMKGDWKQLVQCFSIPSWMKAPAKPICWRCLANKEE